MFLLRYVLRLIFFISLCFSQGPFNSYGIGDMLVWNSASAGGLGSLGLVSSYRQNISLANPTTWSYLKYTFLSLSYNGSESALKNDTKNGYSNLQSAQLIIPIKSEYALGIELHPYSYQNINMIDRKTIAFCMRTFKCGCLDFRPPYPHQYYGQYRWRCSHRAPRSQETLQSQRGRQHVGCYRGRLH
mgnify:CR=1 FL=1